MVGKKQRMEGEKEMQRVRAAQLKKKKGEPAPEQRPAEKQEPNKHKSTLIR